MGVLSVLLIGSVLWNGGRGIIGDKSGTPVPDTMRVTIFDTIAYHQPVPKEEKPLGSITAKLPVSVPKLPESVQKFPEKPQILQDSVQNFCKSVPDDEEVNFLNKDHFEDMGEKISADSVEVQVPITQTKYEGDTYTAYVSGYNASLDSLILRMPHETMTITKRPKPKRWSIGIQVGYGMTLGGTPQFGPYVGVGISYNLFSF